MIFFNEDYTDYRILRSMFKDHRARCGPRRRFLDAIAVLTGSAAAMMVLPKREG